MQRALDAANGPMKMPVLAAVLLIVILVVVFTVYYRPTVHVAWFGRTVGHEARALLGLRDQLRRLRCAGRSSSR